MKAELMRITALPREEYPPGFTAAVTEHFQTPNGAWSLNEAQARLLYAARAYGGAVGAMGVGTGKAEPVTEVVWGPTGPRRMGDLRVGDYVLAGDGTPTRVLGVYPRPVRNVYTVHFSDGAEVDACDEHLWSVSTCSSRAKGSPNRIVTTLDLLARTRSNKHPYAVPTGRVAQFDTKGHLPIDPWVLGVILGDCGLTTNTPDMTNGEYAICAEVQRVLRHMGVSFDFKPTRKGTSYQGYMSTPAGQPNPLTDALRALGVMGRGSPEKFVPTCYLLSSAPNRAALLAGLMDTDGTVSKAACTYSSTSEALADAVVHLVRSLGGIARKTARQTWYTYKGKRRPGKPSWRVSLKLPGGESPFGLSIKDAKFQPPTMYQACIRNVTAVEYKGVEDCVCIAVDHPDRLYMTRDFIVTHNTLATMLLPEMMGIDPGDVVVLCPAGLRDEAVEEWEIYQEHFRVPRLRYVSYATLSNTAGINLLTDLAPQLIIADEAHKLGNRGSARTKRFMKYLRANPDVAFVPMSGTLSAGQLGGFQHLVDAALGEAAPIPRPYSLWQSWARIIDVFGQYDPPVRQDYRRMDALCTWAGTTDHREAFAERWRTAPGVVVSEGSSYDGDIEIRRLRFEGEDLPGDLDEHLRWARESMRRPDGDIFLDPLRLAVGLRQLALGYFLRWRWPVNGDPHYKWLSARSEWQRTCQDEIRRGRKGVDSPSLVTAAIANEDAGLRADTVAAWHAWEAIRGEADPESVPAWVTDKVLRRYVDYAYAAKEGVLVWYQYRAEADALERLGLRVYRAGEMPPRDGRTCALSVRAHGTGYNLQAWGRYLVLHPPANAGAWEQLLGRMARTGQARDRLLVEVAGHTDELWGCVGTARDKAKVVQGTVGHRQYLLGAERTEKII